MRTVSGPLIRHVGSLVGNQIRVPHPAPPGSPEMVELDRLPHVPLDTSVSGQFPVNDWSGDDSIGWWAEARDPGQDAIRAADALAVCGGEGAVIFTNRRFVVVTVAYLFPYFREQPRPEKRSLVGKMWSAVVGPKKYPHHWEEYSTDLAVLWECGADRVRSVTTPLIGRSFPFPRVFRVAFADGSLLYGRYDVGCIVNGDKIKA